MTWNWQHKNWPRFIYKKEDFLDFDSQFLHKAGIMQGSMKHISEADRDILKVDLISNEAFKTSKIEGEILNRDSLQSSIRKHFGLQTDYRKIPPAEQGVAEMMVDLYRNYQLPLEHQHLFNWHQMLMNGRRDITDIGTYRTHEDPMQIVSGAIHRPNVHFEAPPSSRVSKEMASFISWFNHSQQEGNAKMPALIRSGIAHLHFESIHPFEDGNGRIGRAISEKALSQSLGRPTLVAISTAIENDKQAYYATLQSANKELEIDEWLEYFCNMVLKAQDYTQSMIDFLIEKGKFYQVFEEKLNDRQAKVVERVFREGVSGFRGGLSAVNYLTITGTTRATATRDLQKLVELGAFRKTGERKYTRYYLNIDHQSVEASTFS